MIRHLIRQRPGLSLERLVSSKTTQTEGPNRLFDATQRLVDTKQSPFGALSQADWKEGMEMLDQWKALNSSHGVHSSDVLLQRLWLEYAASNPQKAPIDWAKEHTDILKGWLKICGEYPGSYLPVQCAQNAWERMLQRNFPGDAIDLVRIAAAWTLVRPSGLGRGARLVAKTDLESLKGCQTQLFDLAQAMYVELERTDPTAAAALKARLPDLATEWTAEEATDTPVFYGKEDPPVTFEEQQLLDGVVEKVENATPEDNELIRQVLQSWENGNHPVGATKQLLPVIFDFFARSNNLRDAHLVLRTLYSIDTGTESSALHVNRLRSLLSLWSVSEDEKAPWRMDELLRDIESASSIVDDDVYFVVAESWIKSQAVDRETSCRKALHAIHKIREKDGIKAMSIVVRAIVDMPQPSRRDALLALRLLKSNWDRIPEDECAVYAERSCTILSTVEASPDIAMKWVEFLHTKEALEFAPNASHCVIDACGRVCSPEELVALVDRLQTLGIAVDCSVYEKVAMLLIAMRETRRSSHMMILVIKLIDNVQNEVMDASGESIGRVVAPVLDSLSYLQHARQVVSILGKLEMLASHNPALFANHSPLPLDLVRRLLSLISLKGMQVEFHSLFESLRGPQKNGFGLEADAEVYNLAIKSLSKWDSSTTGVDRQADLLNELVDKYKKTGNEIFKPVDQSFHLVLSGIRQFYSGRKSVERGMNLLETMLELRVEIKDSFGFLQVLILYLKLGEGEFEAALRLRELMARHGVKPNGFTLHTILDACGRTSKSSSTDKILSLFLSTYSEIRSAGLVEPKTYAVLLKSLSRIIAPTHPHFRNVIHQVKEACRVDGHLDEQTEALFRMVASRNI